MTIGIYNIKGHRNYIRKWNQSINKEAAIMWNTVTMTQVKISICIVTGKRELIRIIERASHTVDDKLKAITLFEQQIVR